LNGALVRYLDFNDSYLAPGETCHPSDNLAPGLAAAEYATASGRDVLAALAAAYQVQCRLCDERRFETAASTTPLRAHTRSSLASRGRWVSTSSERGTRPRSPAHR
jgi:2-methylcitrate dehydratase PrpD